MGLVRVAVTQRDVDSERLRRLVPLRQERGQQQRPQFGGVLFGRLAQHGLK